MNEWINEWYHSVLYFKHSICTLLFIYLFLYHLFSNKGSSNSDSFHWLIGSLAHIDNWICCSKFTYYSKSIKSFEQKNWFEYWALLAFIQFFFNLARVWLDILTLIISVLFYNQWVGNLFWISLKCTHGLRYGTVNNVAGSSESDDKNVCVSVCAHGHFMEHVLCHIVDIDIEKMGENEFEYPFG